MPTVSEDLSIQHLLRKRYNQLLSANSSCNAHGHVSQRGKDQKWETAYAKDKTLRLYGVGVHALAGIRLCDVFLTRPIVACCLLSDIASYNIV